MYDIKVVQNYGKCDMNRSLIFGVFRCNDIQLNLNQNQAKHMFVYHSNTCSDTLNGEIITNVSSRLYMYQL